MKAKHIIHFIPALTKGGAERVLVDLANGTVRSGHRVTVVAGWDADGSLMRSRLLTEVEVITMMSKRPSTASRYLRGLLWLHRNNSLIWAADIVHVHLTQSSILGTVVYLCRKLLRKSRPLVVETYHSVGMRINRILRWLHSINSRQRDALVLVARDDYWINFRARNHNLKVEFIANGVSGLTGPVPRRETDAFFYSLGLNPKEHSLIGTISRFNSERDPVAVARVLLEVLKDSSENVHAVMGGDGPLLEKVRSHAEEAGLSDRFHLLGLVRDPIPIMSSFSIYVTVNVGPVTGIAALEAAFCKIPIVGLQFDKSYEHGHGDWIWSSRDSGAAASRIRRLLADTYERQHVAEIQHRVATEKFASTQMVERYIHLYERALNHEST